MRHNKNDPRKSKGDLPYVCRICRHPHALRKCSRFLDMNITQRESIVKTYGYCVNCLAHNHSEGSCFTKTGCKICHQKHHTLLHSHPRCQTSSSPPRQSGDRSKTVETAKKEELSTPPMRSYSNLDHTSLSALLKQNAITLLPTILVKICCQSEDNVVRCLLDSGSRSSCITSRIVEKLHLATLALEDETICPLTMISIHDHNVQLQTILKVKNRISMLTPSESIPASFRKNFRNILLADTEFFKSRSVDIILGIDIYARVIREGILNKYGLPTAQNTIFGWSLYGLCSK